MKQYKELIFDLDDTLSNDAENIKYAFRSILKQRGECFTEDKFKIFHQIDINYWKERAMGVIQDPYSFPSNEEKATWNRAQRFIRYFHVSLEEAIQINNEYLKALKEHVVEIPGALYLIEQLYQKGYSIFIATNGPKEAAIEKVNKLKISPFLKDMFFAEDAGYMKPKKEFFNKMCIKFKIQDKSKALLIGDENAKDILGALQYELDCCWYHWKEEKKIVEPTYEIRNLNQLFAIL